MSTFVVMTAKNILPLDLINLLPSLMWIRPFSSCPLSYCHSLAALDSHKVIQATITTCFFMPKIIFILNNVLVIKMNISIMRLFTVVFVVLGAILIMRSCLSSSFAMCIIMGGL